jgi:hypothetical protein
VTKPTAIGLGIAAGGLVCTLLAVTTIGVARLAWAWTAASCAVAAAAYLTNHPAWLGKRHGRQGLRALPLLPYFIALRISFALMRWFRRRDTPTLVAPGVWVAGRVGLDALPPAVTFVVDLVAEYSAPAAVRRLPGYRSLPVLDGGVPPDPGAALGLLRELAAADDEVLVHCDSGRGRAPTFAAALLVARGLAPDTTTALRMIRGRRPVTTPTRADLAFLATIAPVLPTLRRSGPARGRAEPAEARVV